MRLHFGFSTTTSFKKPICLIREFCRINVGWGTLVKKAMREREREIEIERRKEREREGDRKRERERETVRYRERKKE